jgi:prolyl oligopeptidase
MKRLAALLLTLLAACATAPPAAEEADPFRWLEAIDDPKALAWVAEQNERTRRELASAPGFGEMQRHALSVLNAQSRIPTLSWRGRYLYNLWRDADHPRGIYRRTTLEGLRDNRWTTVLDIDAMSRRDGKPWVFKGLNCLPPAHMKCLASLSPGGGDAVEIREFDAESLRFVDDGFFVPLAKSNVSWIDENTLFLGTNFGPESVTESGYPRLVKIWTRGTPMSAARTVYEGDRKSVSASGRRIRTDRGNIDLITEGIGFWKSKRYQLIGLSETRLLDLSDTAVLSGGFQGKLILGLQEDWKTFPTGSVVIVDPAGGDAQLLVAPTATEIVETTGVEVTDHGIYVPILENVRGRLDRFTLNGAWKRERIRFPDNGALDVMTTSDDSGEALVKFETFISPPTLYHVPAGALTPAALMSQQATFDGSQMEVVQQWATSKDGTRVPYFVVARKGMKRDGSNPTHIFSYGGFRSTLKPSYSGTYEEFYGAYGKLWLERGGVFVLANIRGGGEFGPKWHRSVLKENHYRIYEDFEAVAEDLIKTRITSRGKIGIEGRSNGGLLVLSTMHRRPELYGAVIAGVPLSDMQHYHEMLAGASWMGEYGDPRIPAEWAYIRQYSPYHNFRGGVRYPPVFVFASTRDDRVHPGHARKTVARLQAQGHQVWYYENVEGGHGGSSTNDQLAYRIALSYAHLWRTIGAR